MMILNMHTTWLLYLCRHPEILVSDAVERHTLALQGRIVLFFHALSRQPIAVITRTHEERPSLSPVYVDLIKYDLVLCHGTDLRFYA